MSVWVSACESEQIIVLAYLYLEVFVPNLYVYLCPIPIYPIHYSISLLMSDFHLDFLILPLQPRIVLNIFF